MQEMNHYMHHLYNTKVVCELYGGQSTADLKGWGFAG